MHRRVFTEGRPCSSPQSRREWETQKLPPKKKGGSSVLYSGLHEKTKPQELSQTARGDGGTIRKVRKIFPLTRAGSPVMHQCIFAEGWPCSPPNPAGNGKHKSSHRRKKVGAVFCIPDFMEIQTPRAFPNCPGQWRDNSESAGDFSPGEGRLSRYAPMHFCSGAITSFPPIPQGMGNTKAPIEEKRWEQCFIFRISWKFKPQGLSQTARSDGGTIWKARKIFPRQGPALPLCTGAFLQRGGSVLSPQSRMGWEYKTPTSFAKGGSSVYKSRTNR